MSDVQTYIVDNGEEYADQRTFYVTVATQNGAAFEAALRAAQPSYKVLGVVDGLIAWRHPSGSSWERPSDSDFLLDVAQQWAHESRSGLWGDVPQAYRQHLVATWIAAGVATRQPGKAWLLAVGSL